MALLNTWTDANKVIDQGLTITYSVSKIFGNWKQTAAYGASDWVYGSAWEYRRIAKGTFRYVGLDYVSAGDCADAMIAQYTRQTWVSLWDPGHYAMGQAEFDTEDGGTVPMAEVSIQHTEGHMYEVIVNLNEQDTRLFINRQAMASSPFSRENARTYPQF